VENNSRTENSSLLRRRAPSFKTGPFHLDKTWDFYTNKAGDNTDNADSDGLRTKGEFGMLQLLG
jgi:hypothetical protein